MKVWQVRQRALIENARMTAREQQRAEADLFRAGSEEPDGATFHAWSNIELRARQEAVIESISTAVDLDPPGSQMHDYEWGADGRPARVWYASYGSNMSRARFLTYIQGGTPPGSRTHHRGARDRTEPDGDIPIRFFGRMHFAYSSGRWGGGGVAFVDLDTAGHALGRAFHITSEQFDDVVAQENGQTPGVASPVPMSDILSSGRAEMTGVGPYRNIIHIGDYQGAPVMTFTAPFTAADSLQAQYELSGPPGKEEVPLHASNEPSGNYLRMIGSGLSETFGLDDRGQADYLRGAFGADTWNRRELLHTLRTPPDKPKPVHPSKTVFGSGWAASSGRGSAAVDDTWVESALEADLASRAEQQPLPFTSARGLKKVCPLCGVGSQHDLHSCPQLVSTGKKANQGKQPKKPRQGSKSSGKKAGRKGKPAKRT